MASSETHIETDATAHQDGPWLDRDLSLLAFNARVLDWAKRDDVPLLERLRYLCIVSSNLDEFFEVRAALHHASVHHKSTAKSDNKSAPFTQRCCSRFGR